MYDGWRQSKSIPESLDPIHDTLSGFVRLPDRPVVGMAGGNASDRHAVEQPAGQRGRRTASTLCSGRKSGVVVVHGLTPDRNGSADLQVLQASQWIADCPASAGAREMNVDRVIKPNAGIFNSGTSVGNT